MPYGHAESQGSFRQQKPKRPKQKGSAPAASAGTYSAHKPQQQRHIPAARQHAMKLGAALAAKDTGAPQL